MKKLLVAVLVATALPAAAAETEATETYASAPGFAFQLALATVAGPAIARVANDLAVAYQAKCGAPMPLSALRAILRTPAAKQALEIARAQESDLSICRRAGERCLNAERQSEYLSLVTTPTCQSAKVSAVDDHAARFREAGAGAAKPIVTDEAIAERLAYRREAAIDDPSEENIAAYLEIQNLVLTRAEVAAWQATADRHEAEGGTTAP